MRILLFCLAVWPLWTGAGEPAGTATAAGRCDGFPWTKFSTNQAGSPTEHLEEGGDIDQQRIDGGFTLQIVVTGLRHDPARVDGVFHTWALDAVAGVAPPPIYATAVQRATDASQSDDTNDDGIEDAELEMDADSTCPR